ncbi:MAG: hypothetical protein IV086_06510 [Hyphomonadaceae bacterium]|nr:MAG: hypothetical protein FD160_3673 [Caulobacteraceae bacterium]MBT9445334.1 hypothetical protein [Hyphomonadaceae bacterium]TPW04672.1 MAG: hypothetical protein FD124_2500 [Alphaproteobacteria bacterium]
MQSTTTPGFRRLFGRSTRPTPASRSNVTFGVRLTGGEYAEIAAVAAKLDVTITALMRTSALITARMAPALLTQEAIAVYRAGQGASAASRVLAQLLSERRAGGVNGDVRSAIERVAVEVSACRDAYLRLTAAHMRRAASVRAALRPARSRRRRAP